MAPARVLQCILPDVLNNEYVLYAAYAAEGTLENSGLVPGKMGNCGSYQNMRNRQWNNVFNISDIQYYYEVWYIIFTYVCNNSVLSFNIS